MSLRSWRLWGPCQSSFLLAALAIAAGCTSSGNLPTSPVKGRVTYRGKPVPNGTVMFVPETGPAATGELTKDGTFVLTTYSNGDGAVLGMHKVAITALQDTSGLSPEQSGTPAPLVPEKYLGQDTSGLTFEVKEGENEANFTLPQ